MNRAVASIDKLARDLAEASDEIATWKMRSMSWKRFLDRLEAMATEGAK